LAATVERRGYFSDPFFLFRAVRKDQFQRAAGSDFFFRTLFLTTGKKGEGTGGRGNDRKAPRANLNRRRFVPGAPPPEELKNRTSL
jgi:hypothetical protein